MEMEKLNRPLISYIATQSALVLIILAATYLVTDLMLDVFGWTVAHKWVSLVLVVFAQLPVAIIYSKNETRTLSSGEGWALAFVFVSVTVLFETLLVGGGRQFFQVFATLDESLFTTQVERFGYTVCGFLLSIIAAVFAAKTLFGLAVRNNLKLGNNIDQYTRLLIGIPGLKLRRTQNLFSRPCHRANAAELYRRELIGANIGIFGLSLLVFGPDFMHVLKLSIPVSIVFSIVCVANQLAKNESKATLSERCLSISIELLPLTVTSLLLLGASELYANFAMQNEAQVGFVAYTKLLVLQSVQVESDLARILVYLGVIFSLSLAANTLLLVVFTKLIQPLVVSSLKTMRPTNLVRYDEILEIIGLKDTVPAQFVRPVQRRSNRSKRPVVSLRPASFVDPRT